MPLSSYGKDSGPAGAYTPLEKQIYQLKKAHPGILLLIEVGGLRALFRCFSGTQPALLHPGRTSLFRLRARSPLWKARCSCQEYNQ